MLNVVFFRITWINQGVFSKIIRCLGCSSDLGGHNVFLRRLHSIRQDQKDKMIQISLSKNFTVEMPLCLSATDLLLGFRMKF